MASTTMVHIRVDEKLKREAWAALDGMGLSLSDAVRLLLVRVAAEKALPFEIRVPNTSTIRAMEDVNVGTLESFESVTALMASIDENNRRNTNLQGGLEKSLPGSGSETNR